MPYQISRRNFLQSSVAWGLVRIPDRVVVLTLDDAVKSQHTFVAPLLKELGFGATFFVTHEWMPDHEYFMTWEEIAELHRMGFEIGNHSWTHANFSVPRNAARLDGELALVSNELKKVGVPRPLSFAWCGNAFGPEALRVLTDLGYRFARRGMQPEVPYGSTGVGPAYDPKRHHPLLIPTTGDAYPNSTFERFQRIVNKARDGRIAVLQFHGVPDIKHPWVSTTPELFRQCMEWLKKGNFRVIAMRDLEPYVDRRHLPDDPMEKVRYQRIHTPKDAATVALLPVEMEATKADLRYWLEDMVTDHHYTPAEVEKVCGMTEDEAKRKASGPGISPAVRQAPVKMLPYPGGRHPRIGFLEGAIDPHRGTKASIFLPWDPASYVVVDLPEAIFCNLGLLFLAHTHVPTIWNDQNIVIENVDWERPSDGSLHSRWVLPNKVSFGAKLQPVPEAVEMELWLKNGTPQPLSRLRAQICVLLKGAQAFNSQTNDNKIFRNPVAAVRSTDGLHWILTEWERWGRSWGNPLCPCLHSDPVLPDCAPGETVVARGKIRFYEGREIDPALFR